MATAPVAPIPIFISFDPRDRPYRDQLRDHLSPLNYEGQITLWDRAEVEAGTLSEPQVEQRLNASELILFLVSSAFLSSGPIRNHEMPLALKRHEEGHARVIPVIVRPVDWEHERFNQLPVVLPHGARAVTGWSPQDRGWTDVAKGVRAAVGELRAPPTAREPDAPSIESFVGQDRARLDQLGELAAEYNRLRGRKRAGWDRTVAMTDLVSRARRLAPDPESSVRMAENFFRRGGDGDRVVALALLEVHPDPGRAWIVEDAIGQSRSAFEQYRGLVALEPLVPLLGAEARQRFAQIILAQRNEAEGGYITPITESRWALSGRIFPRLNVSPRQAAHEASDG